MNNRAVVLIVALWTWGCGGIPGSSPTGPTGGTCTITPEFGAVGQLGEIQYNTTSDHLNLLVIQVEDYATTCGASNGPPSYSAQNYWHGVGFQIQADDTPPFTVTYPGTQGSGPTFGGCSFGDGVGGDGPIGLVCGGSYTCQSGSSVTVTAASPNSASGMYALTVSNGVDAPLSVVGAFDVSASCPTLD